jgi:hypothetical protein
MTSTRLADLFTPRFRAASIRVQARKRDRVEEYRKQELADFVPWTSSNSCLVEC